MTPSTYAKVMMLLVALLLVGCDDSPTEPPDPVPASVQLTPDDAELTYIGAAIALHAAALDEEGDPITGANFNWSSSDESVARVNALGEVVAEAVGTATVTATSGDASGTAEITVEQVADAVEASRDELVLLAIGASHELSADVVDAGENPIDELEVTWSSSDESVVTVDADGVVEAVGVGEASIVAEHDELEGLIEVRVHPAQTVEVDPADIALDEIGATAELEAVVLDAAGDEIDGAEVSWSSSDEEVASVDADGEVEAVGEGTAVITAQAGNAAATVQVTVEIEEG